MENNLNLRTSTHPYLQQFNFAQLNLAKVLEEEREAKRKEKNRIRQRRHYE